MKSPLFRLLPFVALLLPLHAQSDKARNFYEALRKRPAAAALFDQFYSAWLDTETVEKLEAFLTGEAEKLPEARMILAEFYARQGALDKSAEAWRAALKVAPQRADAWLALAELEARQRRHREALEAAEKGLLTKPAPDLERRLLECKARTLVRDNKHAEARAVWESLLKAYPGDEDLRDDYIDLLTQTGDAAAAVEAAQQLAGKTTDPYRRVLRRARVGDLLAEDGEGRRAIEEYAAALADTGAGSWLEKDMLRQIETVYRRDDALNSLTEFLKELAAKEPQRLAVRGALARVLTERDEKEEADKVWRELLAAAPGDREMAEAFIRHLTDTRRPAEAAAQWRSLIALHPADAELRLQLAAALHAAKDHAGCAAAVRDYLKTAGDSEEASLRAAAELAKFKLNDESLALLAETARRFPASESARLQFAAVLYASGKKDEARAAWRVEAARPGRLMPVARAALAMGEHALTWELLEPHLADFEKDAAALMFICDVATRSEKWAAGAAQGRRLTALATDAVSLGDALTLTLRLAERGGLSGILRKELEGRRAQLSAAESCLLAELLQTAGDRSAAAALLEEVSAREPALGLALLVRLHVARKDFSAAARAQLRLVEAPGGRKPVHMQRLIELYNDAKSTAEALRWTLEWKKLAPGNPAPWLREASLLQLSGRQEEMLKGLQQAAHLWPDDADVLSRLASACAAARQPARAQQIYLRLFEKAESTGDKLRWLPALVDNAAASNQLNALIADFERRRSQNRLSPVPLLALAECYGQNGNDEARLEMMREAARLGEGDPALLQRAAQFAVENGLLEMADSILAEAALKDKTGAAVQQRIAVLLHLNRHEQAMALLTQLAAGLNLEESAELALALSQIGQEKAAAAFIRQAAERVPDNYRLAWLAVQLTLDEQNNALALQWLLRLATTSFQPMPDGPPVPPAQPTPFRVTLRTGGGPRTMQGTTWPALPAAASLLSPPPDDTPPPVSGSEEEQAAVLRAMQERSRHLQQQSATGDNGPLMPGALWQVRGWAAGDALRLAGMESPERVAAVKAALLAAGIRPAVFGEWIAGGRDLGVRPAREIPDISTAGTDAGWLLRFLLGSMESSDASPAVPPQTFVSNGIVYPVAGFDEPEPSPVPVWTAREAFAAVRPVALAAWRHFRESDPAYAVQAALLLVDSNVPEEREAAAAAIALMEQQREPGKYLTSAISAMERGEIFTAGAAGIQPPATLAIRSRLFACFAQWLQKVPSGAERSALREQLLSWRAQGDDSAAYLNLIAEEVAAGAPAGEVIRGNDGDWLNRAGQQGWTNYSPMASSASAWNGAAWNGSGSPVYVSRRIRSTYSGTAGYGIPGRTGTPAGRPAAPAGPNSILPAPGAVLLLPLVPLTTGEQVSAGGFDGPLFRTAARLAPGPWSADAAKLRAAVAQCPDAGVKAAASLLVQDEALTAQCMEALAKEQPPVTEHLLLAAAWEWRHRRAAAAVALLERAGALEPDNVPKAADTAILGALNLLIWAREPLADSVKTAARAALQRFAALPLPDDYRPSLSGLAEVIGSPELVSVIAHAPQMAAQMPQPTPAAAGASRSAHPLASFVTTLQRRERAGGTRDGNPLTVAQEAELLVAMEKRSIATAPATAAAPYSGSRIINYGRRPSGAVDNERIGKVMQEILAMAKKSEDATEILAAGLALLHAVNFESQYHSGLAIPVIERAVAAAPGNQRLRLVAARALAAQGPASPVVTAVIKLSAGLAAADRAALLVSLASSLAAAFSALEPPMRARETTELLDAWLDALNDLPVEAFDLEFNRVSAMLSLLDDFPAGTGSRGRPRKLPSEPEDQALRRRELHAALCRELLRFPQVAAAVFRWMAERVHNGQWNWENRRADTLAVLKLTAASGAELAVPEWPGRNTHVTNVFLEAAVADPAWLEQTALPALRAAGREGFARQAAQLLELIRCAPADFIASADKVAAETPESQRYGLYCQAAAIAGLRGGLDNVLPGLIARALSTNRGVIPPGLAFAAVRQLHTAGGQAGVNTWVKSVCGEPQPADIWSRPRSPQGSPGKGFRALAGLLDTSSLVVTLGGPAAMRLMRALETPMLALPRGIPVRLPSNFFNPDIKRSADEIMAIMDACGLLEDLTDCRPALYTSGQRTVSTLEEVTVGCARMLRQTLYKDANGGAATAVLEKLEKDHAHTFGGRLAAAMVREVKQSNESPGENGSPELLRLLAAEMPRLKALPRDRQLEFVTLTPHHPPGDDKAALAAEEWLTDLRSGVMQRMLDSMMAMRDDELLRDVDLRVRLPEICTEFLPENPEAVLTLLARVADLPGSSYPPPEVSELLAGTVANWSYHGLPIVQGRRLRALLTILGDARPGLLQSWGVADHAGGLLKRWLMQSTDFKLPDSLPLLLERLESVPADFLTEKQARLLLPAVVDVVAAIERRGDAAEVSARVAEALEKTGGGGRLRSVLADAFRLTELHQRRGGEADEMVMALREAAGKHAARGYLLADAGQNLSLPGAENAAALTEPQRHFLAALTDDSIPPPARLAVCKGVPQQVPRIFDPPLLLAAVAMLQNNGPAPLARDERKFRLALALSKAALLFHPLPAESYRSAERFILQSLMENATYAAAVDVRTLLLAAHSTGDRELSDMLEAVIKQADKNLAGAFRTLVNHRRFAAASLLLTEIPDRLFPGPPGIFSASELYAPQTAAALEDFLKTLPDEPGRMAARAIMDSAFDSPELVAAGGPSRTARLESLAKTLTESNLPLVWLQRVMMVFGRDFPERHTLEPLLAKALQGSSLPDAMTAPENLRDLYFQRLQTLADGGKLEELVATFRELPSVAPLMRATVREKYWAVFRAALEDHSAEWPEASRQRALEFLRAAALNLTDLEKRLNAGGSDGIAESLAFCLVMHAAWEALPVLESALAALPQAERNKLWEQPAMAGAVFHLLGQTEADAFTSETVHLWCPVTVPRQGAVLAQLLASPRGLPGLDMGMLYQYVTSREKGFDAAPLLDMAPQLLPRTDATAASALWDAALLLAEAKRPDAARQCLPVLEKWFGGWSGKEVPEQLRTKKARAFGFLFSTRKVLDGAEAALAWALQNGSSLDQMSNDPFTAEIILRLHLQLNLADSALLKSSGAEAWKKQAAARFNGVPESALGFFQAACVLEKVADLEAAAGRHEAAFAAISLALLTTAHAGYQSPGLLDTNSKEIFLANYAELALRAGKKVEFVELLPLQSAWVPRLAGTRGGAKGDGWAAVKAPLGWNAPALGTALEKPQADPAEPFSRLLLRCDLSLPNEVNGDTLGIIYSTFCDLDDPGQSFAIGSDTLTWAESGRPERSPALSAMCKNPADALNAVNARTTLLGPAWLKGDLTRRLGVSIDLRTRKSESLRFDGALHGLKLTYARALEQAEAHRDELEKAAPEFWKQLPVWVRRR